jgi:hypothetical protein
MMKLVKMIMIVAVAARRAEPGRLRPEKRNGNQHQRPLVQNNLAPEVSPRMQVRG